MVCVSSGDEARALLQRDARFDVILCDLMMENGSGMDLYAWLEQHHPRLADKTLVISGGGVTPEARAFLQRLGSRALSKPLDVPQFIARVERLVEGGLDAREGT